MLRGPSPHEAHIAHQYHACLAGAAMYRYTGGATVNGLRCQLRCNLNGLPRAPDAPPLVVCRLVAPINSSWPTTLGACGVRAKAGHLSARVQRGRLHCALADMSFRSRHQTERKGRQDLEGKLRGPNEGGGGERRQDLLVGALRPTPVPRSTCTARDGGTEDEKEEARPRRQDRGVGHGENARCRVEGSGRGWEGPGRRRVGT